MVDNAEIKAKKEILIYSPIFDEVIAEIVEDINEFEDADNLVIRIHTPGGNVMGGYAILSRLADRKGSTDVMVDGQAYSMGAYISLYANNVRCVETAKFMFHKAAFPSWHEESEAEKLEVKEINARFKAKMISRFNDTPLAKEIIAKVFEVDVKNDVYLTAKDAKAVGLVSEIMPIDLGIKAKIEGYTQMYAMFANQNINEKTSEVGVLKPQINNNMNIQELKAQHPAVYDEVIALGRAIGVSAEKDRVGSFLAFLDIAPSAVKAGIESGVAISETQRSEFAISAYKATQNALQAKDNMPAVATGAAPVAVDPQIAQRAEIDAELKKNGLTIKS